MKNRAKCKLCNDILESLHRYDYLACKCGEISISGGNEVLECSARNWTNFLRIDDEGNEIVVKIIGSDENAIASDESRLNKSQLIEMLENMLKSIENLPQNAMLQPVSHYDLYNYIAVILSILKSDSNYSFISLNKK